MIRLLVNKGESTDFFLANTSAFYSLDFDLDV